MASARVYADRDRNDGRRSKETWGTHILGLYYKNTLLAYLNALFFLLHSQGNSLAPVVLLGHRSVFHFFLSLSAVCSSSTHTHTCTLFVIERGFEAPPQASWTCPYCFDSRSFYSYEGSGCPLADAYRGPRGRGGSTSLLASLPRSSRPALSPTSCRCLRLS